MLIDSVTSICDSCYHRMKDEDKECTNCNHLYGFNGVRCPEGGKSCKTCLDEIHFPDNNPNRKTDYDCNPIMYFYTCCYAHKYASEMLYLMDQSELIDNISNFHVVSIGCGCCPDLMALEKYINVNMDHPTIQYCGIDLNTRWMPIHKIVDNYCRSNKIRTNFLYGDAITYLKTNNINGANVLVLEYFISSLINSGALTSSNMKKFWDLIIEKIILNRDKSVPFIVLINDVNHYAKGRDGWMGLFWELKDNYHIYGGPSAYYFNYKIKNDGQRFGDMQHSTELLFPLPSKLDYYQPWKDCSSASFLLEIDGGQTN